MVRKNIITLFLFCCMSFLIIGCNENNKQQTVTQNVATQELNIDNKNDSVLEEAWQIPTSVFQNSFADDSLKDFIDVLEAEYGNNAFTKELSSLYKKLDIDNKSDFEKDFLDLYIYVKKSSEISFDEITKIWKVAYDENNNLINGEDNLVYRAIAFETPSNEIYKQCFFSIFHFYYEGQDKGMMRGVNTLKKRSSFGIGSDEEKGFWNVNDGDEELNGRPYELVDESEINKILDENQEIISLLDQYYDTVFNPKYEVGEQNKKIKEEQRKPKEPSIGMTKEEIERSTWGYPDSKNINEYAWGTHEQWVYRNKGYIYFEDGIVTSIQKR